jgi:hypothetical protein
MIPAPAAAERNTSIPAKAGNRCCISTEFRGTDIQKKFVILSDNEESAFRYLLQHRMNGNHNILIRLNN